MAPSLDEPESEATMVEHNADSGHCGLRLVSSQARMPGFDDLRLDVLLAEQQLMLQMCALLESVADSLPDAFSPLTCRRVAALLAHDLPLHHDNIRRFAANLRHRGARALAESLLDSLFREDEDLAADIVGCLSAMGDGVSPENPEQAGYMMRCFFQGYRKTALIARLVLQEALDGNLQHRAANMLSLRPSGAH